MLLSSLTTSQRDTALNHLIIGYQISLCRHDIYKPLSRRFEGLSEFSNYRVLS